MKPEGRTHIKIITEILATQLGHDEADITPEKTLYGLGADSLDTVEIIMAFEEVYDIDIDIEDVEHIRDVAGVIAYIEGRFSPENIETSDRP